MQSGSFQRTISSTAYSPTAQTAGVLSPAVNGLLAIALPVMMLCAMVGYRKCQAAVLQRRIKYLNRLWQLDSSKNPF
jgi:hypothetical protein